MRYISLTFLALVVLLLNGCTGLVTKSCPYDNWYVRGYKDGTEGRNMTRIEEYRAACTKLDLNRYQAGRKAGLVYHCTGTEAFRTAHAAIEVDKGDWQAVGREHGIAGKAYHFKEYAQRCGSFGVSAQESDYKTGYDSGIRRFCSATNGFNVGKEGKAYTAGLCAHSETTFLRAYIRGVNEKIHQIDQYVAEKAGKISQYNTQYNQTTSGTRRAQLQRNIADLQEALTKLRQQRQDADSLRLYAELQLNKP